MVSLNINYMKTFSMFVLSNAIIRYAGLIIGLFLYIQLFREFFRGKISNNIIVIQIINLCSVIRI